jgi:hypothetical protein
LAGKLSRLPRAFLSAAVLAVTFLAEVDAGSSVAEQTPQQFRLGQRPLQQFGDLNGVQRRAFE